MVAEQILPLLHAQHYPQREHDSSRERERELEVGRGEEMRKKEDVRHVGRGVKES